MVLGIIISRHQASKLARLIRQLIDLENTLVFIIKYMNNELIKLTEKLKQIDRLTNSMQKIDSINIKNDIAYFIHTIIESDEMTLDMYRQVGSYSILANKDLFINI